MGPAWYTEGSALCFEGSTRAMFSNAEEALRAADCLNVLIHFGNPKIFTYPDLCWLLDSKREKGGE